MPHVKTLLVSLAGILAAAIVPNVASAQSAPEVIQVRDVKFSLQRDVRGNNMIEARIDIEPMINPVENPINPDFVDDVKLTLNVAFQPESGDYHFYRSSVEIVTLELRNRYSIYFYLPAEIVKRDRLRRDPFAWLLEFEVGGQALPGQRSHVSRSLGNASALEGFKSRLNSDAPANDGKLLPIYDTIYWFANGERDKIETAPPYVIKPRQ